jgi:hypothetical protein
MGYQKEMSAEQQEQWLANAVASIKVRSATELAMLKIPDDHTLLGNRWLCRGGSALWVSVTGVGKTSAICAASARWALGKPAFGIVCPRPLRILILQSENDDADMREMFEHLADEKTVSDDEWKLLGKRVFITEKITKWSGSVFIAILKRLVEKYQPDLIVLDPLNGFSGSDVMDAQGVVSFMRDELGTLLEDFQCGALVLCHSPKQRTWNTEKWRPVDWSYVPAGRAELSNLARAILVIDSTDDEEVFRFIAAKRGTRIGWVDDMGQQTREKYFRYSGGKVIGWEEASPEDIQEARRAQQERTKRGPKQKYPDRVLLGPLYNSSGLELDPYWRALSKSGCEVAKSTLSGRLDRMLEAGLVSKEGKLWVLSNSENGEFMP